MFRGQRPVEEVEQSAVKDERHGEADRDRTEGDE
jgi:hypothetical protein